MANPLLMFLVRSDERRRAARRRPVAVPRQTPSTDAIFLMMRRIRTPLLLIIAIFTISTVGLTLIPGQDEQGHVTHLTIFEAFYFISYMATTIGFGEIVPFTTPQRMWVTFSIYLTVVGWAYAIASALSLLQDDTFREAVASQRFRRRVRRLREGFVIVAGYGQAGRQVTRELDRAGRRVVVLDHRQGRIDRLAADSLYADVPALDADASVPGVLGIAGLGSPRCRAVLALTDDDDVNLAVVMTATLLRPDLPVVARCHDPVIEERMRDFGPMAVVNPGDRYGAYLVLALQRPATSRLVTWLLAGPDAPLPALPHGLAAGRWVIAADGAFGQEVAADLRAIDLPVRVVDPRAERPDVTDAVGFVAGTDVDTLNLALAERARRDNPDVYVSVRQGTDDHRALVEALAIDSVFRPTDVVAVEALGRVVTPVFWQFVEYALRQDDVWAADLLERLVDACGEGGPHRTIVTLDRAGAPAVHRWLRHSTLAAGELLRDPDDAGAQLAVVPLVHLRGEDVVHAPPDDLDLRAGDRLLLAGRARDLARLRQSLDYDSVVEYVATGRRLPDSLIWRVLIGARARGDRRRPRR